VTYDRDRRRAVCREGICDSRENGRRRAAFVCDVLCYCCVLTQRNVGVYLPGLFLGKTVVGHDRRWNSGEEGLVEWLEDEICIGQEGGAGGFCCDE
jgi:hypothetical protein